MVSIAKLMNRKSDEVVRLLGQMVSAISRTAIEADPADIALFRAKLQHVGQQLTESAAPDRIQQTISETIQLLEQYNQSVIVSSTNYREEMRRALGMMAETIAAMSQSSQTNIQQLRTIEQGLQTAATISDLKALRNKLAVCLAVVRTETVRAQHESDKLLGSLKDAVLRATCNLSPHLDRATALPGPKVATQKMERLIESGKAFHAVMFLLEGVQGLNARYGRAGGDEALLLAAQHLRTTFAEEGTVVRWNGPAFLLISEDKADPPAPLERKVKDLMRSRFEAAITTETGTARVQLGLSWTSLHVTPTDSCDAVCRKLDGFVSSQPVQL